MADLFRMDGHKLHWHPERIKEWMDGKTIAPLYIDMGITQTCNIHCQYCYYAVPENRTKETISTENLIKFLNEAAEAGVKAIGFLGDGEPMIHSGVYDAVIAGAKAGLDMAISSNGTMMKDEKIEDFLRALTWIRFNISAATPEKYETVMGTNKRIFDKVTTNIKKCTDLKKKLGLNVTIGLQMVLIEECADQIVPFAILGKELGVDYVVIKQCSEHGEIGHDLIVDKYDKYEDRFKEAESYSDGKYNVIIKREKMAKKKRNYNSCNGCEFLPQITGAGEVYTCGNFFGNKDFLMGNINKQSFKDIIKSDRYKEVMKKVRTEVNVHKQCGLGCRQNELNEYLWMLKNPPEHLNFI